MNKELSPQELEWVKEDLRIHPFLQVRAANARFAPMAAANIRRWLTSLYPEHKFSAVSKQFAGGSSVEVQWSVLPGAPLAEDVAAILERFEYGFSLDGVTQQLERDKRVAFHAAFGSAKYVRSSTRDPSLEELASFEARSARATEKHLRSQVAKAPRSARPRM